MDAMLKMWQVEIIRCRESERSDIRYSTMIKAKAHIASGKELGARLSYKYKNIKRFIPFYIMLFSVLAFL